MEETTWESLAREWETEQDDRPAEENPFKDERTTWLLENVAGITPVEQEQEIWGWGYGFEDWHIKILKWMDGHGMFVGGARIDPEVVKKFAHELMQDTEYEKGQLEKEGYPGRGRDELWSARQTWSWMLREMLRVWILTYGAHEIGGDDEYYDYYPLEGEYWMFLLKKQFRNDEIWDGLGNYHVKVR